MGLDTFPFTIKSPVLHCACLLAGTKLFWLKNIQDCSKCSRRDPRRDIHGLHPRA